MRWLQNSPMKKRALLDMYLRGDMAAQIEASDNTLIDRYIQGEIRAPAITGWENVRVGCPYTLRHNVRVSSFLSTYTSTAVLSSQSADRVPPPRNQSGRPWGVVGTWREPVVTTARLRGA